MGLCKDEEGSNMVSSYFYCIMYAVLLFVITKRFMLICHDMFITHKYFYISNSII